eukprot:1852172-Amphidinium_carterae.1
MYVCCCRGELSEEQALCERCSANIRAAYPSLRILERQEKAQQPATGGQFQDELGQATCSFTWSRLKKFLQLQNLPQPTLTRPSPQ